MEGTAHCWRTARAVRIGATAVGATRVGFNRAAVHSQRRRDIRRPTLQWKTPSSRHPPDPTAGRLTGFVSLLCPDSTPSASSAIPHPSPHSPTQANLAATRLMHWPLLSVLEQGDVHCWGFYYPRRILGKSTIRILSRAVKWPFDRSRFRRCAKCCMGAPRGNDFSCVPLGTGRWSSA